MKCEPKAHTLGLVPKGNRHVSQGLHCTLGHLHWMEKCRQPNVFQFGWGLITEPTELLSVFAFVPVMKLWLVLRKPSFVSFCNTQTIPDKKASHESEWSCEWNESLWQDWCETLSPKHTVLVFTLRTHENWLQVVTDYYSFWIVNHKCIKIWSCDSLAMLTRLVNALLAKTIKPHREGV